jgi:hypothetical protein
VTESDRKKGAANAPVEAVKEPFLPILNILAARQSHDSPLFNISNGECVGSAKNNCENSGCPMRLYDLCKLSGSH